jgi:uncharacterized protein (TIGR02594 family)
MLKLLIKLLQSLDGTKKAEKGKVARPTMDRLGSHLDLDRKVWVQKKLKALGYLHTKKLYRDFVPAVIRAVEAFQLHHKLEVDGIVGAATWAALQKAELSETASATDLYKVAMRDYGLQEIVGPRHSKRIVEMFVKAGHPEVTSDETAWCSAAMNTWAVEAGLKGTGSLLARSWLKWGNKVLLKDFITKPRSGVVAVFKRGNSSWQGHVALTTGRLRGNEIEILGGNQSNSVNKKWANLDDLLDLRSAA